MWCQKNEWWWIVNWSGYGSKHSWPNLWHYHDIWQELLRNVTRNFSGDNQCHCKDSDLACVAQSWKNICLTHLPVWLTGVHTWCLRSFVIIVSQKVAHVENYQPICNFCNFNLVSIHFWMFCYVVYASCFVVWAMQKFSSDSTHCIFSSWWSFIPGFHLCTGNCELLAGGCGTELPSLTGFHQSWNTVFCT
jgi:hypothetical protein